MDSSGVILGIGGIFGVLIILSAISVLVYIFATKEEKKTTAVVVPKKEERTPVTPAARVSEEEEKEKPADGCPSVPYTYCSSDTIKNVYIASSCGPSSRLVEKLTSEGKITGEDDPKVINCSENQDLCTAAGIKSYPSIICENSPSNIYQGYCK